MCEWCECEWCGYEWCEYEWCGCVSGVGVCKEGGWSERGGVRRGL